MLVRPGGLGLNLSQPGLVKRPGGLGGKAGRPWVLAGQPTLEAGRPPSILFSLLALFPP